MDIMQRFYQTGVVPVVVLDDASDALLAADALGKGGIDLMEVTFRTDAAEESISMIVRERPDILIGAGTVITTEQCERAVRAGAKFIVSPGFDADVVGWCLAREIPVFPGCVTPTEIMMGKKLGLNAFKFFPANVCGGLKAMKALSAPFPGIRFIPTGGVNGENLAEYLRAPFVWAVGGSWLCTREDIKAHNWDRIAALSADAARQVRAVRG